MRPWLARVFRRTGCRIDRKRKSPDLLSLLRLALLTELLLHLLLKLLCLALQHFLLPFLFGSLRTVALLLGEILLAMRQLVELFQCVVDFLGLLLGS
jgi:hypothetical protein